MLAALAHEPFDKPRWVYEEKYDGYRILAYKEGSKARLLSRNSIDRTARFPGIAAAISKLTPATLLLDGEAVVFDSKGVSRFQLLQQDPAEATYAVFDCLHNDGKDLRALPLSARRSELEKSLRPGKALMLSQRLPGNGFEAYRVAKKKNYGGLVAKDKSSPYVEGRSKLWLKVKVHLEDEFVIGGFTKPSGLRKYFGALLLGVYDHSKLRYVGKVGTGFSEETLSSLHRKFVPLIRKQSPFADPVPEKDITFLAPRLVVQIAYQEWTADNKLRQPVFLGLRDDKDPRQVHFPEPSV